MRRNIKIEQYSRRNSVEISGISNDVLDKNLEGKVIDIWKEAVIDLKPMIWKDVVDYHQDVLTLTTANAW